MIGYSVFALFLDFGPFKVWNDNAIGIFRILDIAFSLYFLGAALFFWFYRNENYLIKNSGIKLSLFFVLLWSGIITGIELSSLGFSTLIVVVLVTVFFIYIKLITSVIFLTGAFFTLIGTVFIRTGLDDSVIPAFTILIPIIVISILISHKNYRSKVNELIRTDKLNELNNELNAIKENLEDKVERRTIELSLAKEKAEESDRLKSAFLANMSHEIRTPMNGILGFAELLKEPGLSGEDQANYISMIEEGGERMLNIINNLIDISKLESGMTKVSISETNVNKQLDYIHSFFMPEVEQKGMKLFCKTSLEEKEAVIQTDREKVYAILTNLVKNAIKYSESGYIEIGCSLKSESTESVRARLELEFYVKDTGIGIAINRQTAVFERFIQADIGDKRAYQGAGLGLSISKGYAELLGGKMWMESEAGKGSVFYFTIPYNTKT
jgi:signal transduction histidine kinase